VRAVFLAATPHSFHPGFWRSRNHLTQFLFLRCRANRILLAGSTAHSEFGLMKAQWGEAKYVDMENRPFPFTPLDMASIGARLNVGRCRGKADEAPEAKGQSQHTLVRIRERSENPK
jgi:hypothetical protein